MKKVCSYCEKHLGDIEPYDSDLVTHGMCQSCAEYFLKQWDGLELDEFLDEFTEPVLVVDGSVRVIAANTPMKEILQKENVEIQGYRGGEVISCQYARHPEGCGCTVHCAACTIRNTVTKAAKTGQPQLNKEAFLNQETRDIELLISAEPKDNYIILRIDKIAKISEKDQESNAEKTYSN